MLKESIRGTFFAIQANFCFNDMNFTDAKFDKDPVINRNNLSRKLLLTELHYIA